MYLILFKVALKSDDSSKKKEKNDVVETSTAPPNKMSSSTINTKEIISQRNMEKTTSHLQKSTTRLNRTDTHRIDLNNRMKKVVGTENELVLGVFKIYTL